MSCLGNIVWLLLGGMISGLAWMGIGVLWCITIIGIPIGVQCFKIAALSFFPFGKEVEYGTEITSFILNVFWIIFGGLELAVMHLICGLIFCITIIGIPFGLQHFKLAKLSLMPFGAIIT